MSAKFPRGGGGGGGAGPFLARSLNTVNGRTHGWTPTAIIVHTCGSKMYKFSLNVLTNSSPTQMHVLNDCYATLQKIVQC